MLKSMKNILVLGHNGMLGQMVCNYFSANNNYTIHTIPYRFDEKEPAEFLNECSKEKYEIVINCIGKIKQKTDDLNDLLMANAILPLGLVEHLRESQTLVHPSTDCVFDGTKGSPYTISETPNAVDAYGWSKRLGETAVSGRKNTLLLRVSIIGPDNNSSGKGLLNWFTSNKEGCRLNGFTNHYWNGITTLEWCKRLEEMLKGLDKEVYHFCQLGTKESYTKFEMLELFQEVYNTGFDISKSENQPAVDRRLNPTCSSKSLKQQLIELKEF